MRLAYYRGSVVIFKQTLLNANVPLRIYVQFLFCPYRAPTDLIQAHKVQMLYFWFLLLNFEICCVLTVNLIHVTKWHFIIVWPAMCDLKKVV